MTIKTSIEPIEQNSFLPACSVTLAVQKDGNKLDTYFTTTEGSIEERLILASNPNIDQGLAKILRYDEEITIRQAIISNQNIPCFFRRQPKSVAELLPIMQEVTALHLSLSGTKIAIATRAELYEDRWNDSASQIGVIEFSQRVAITIEESASGILINGDPINYQVWLMGETGDESMALIIETESLHRAVATAIHIFNVKTAPDLTPKTQNTHHFINDGCFVG